jgi:hypothetical protein
MGVRVGASGFQSQATAKYAGKQALERFLEELSKEEKWSTGPGRFQVRAAHPRLHPRFLFVESEAQQRETGGLGAFGHRSHRKSAPVASAHKEISNCMKCKLGPSGQRWH